MTKIIHFYTIASLVAISYSCTHRTQNDSTVSIAGGKYISDANHPLAKRIGAFTDIDGKTFCSGSLVAKRFVLTAAHCFMNDFYQHRYANGTPLFVAFGPQAQKVGVKQNANPNARRIVNAGIHRFYRLPELGKEITAKYPAMVKAQAARCQQMTVSDCAKAADDFYRQVEDLAYYPSKQIFDIALVELESDAPAGTITVDLVPADYQYNFSDNGSGRSTVAVLAAGFGITMTTQFTIPFNRPVIIPRVTPPPTGTNAGFLYGVNVELDALNPLSIPDPSKTMILPINGHKWVVPVTRGAGEYSLGGTPNKAVCPGDSGGPQFVGEIINGVNTLLQAGITSRGEQICENARSVATDLRWYNKFVRCNAKTLNDPQCPQEADMLLSVYQK